MFTKKLSSDADNEAVAANAQLKEKVKQQEQMVRTQLGKNMQKVQQEAAKLKKIEAILAQLEVEQQQDINILMKKIQSTEHALCSAQQRFTTVEAEYKAAKEELDKQTERKMQLTEHLKLVIFENESKKQAKLEKLMRELGIADGSGGDNEKGFSGFKA